MSQDNTQEVYNPVSTSNDGESNNSKINQKWTFFLISCSVVVSLASFVYGYNIGVINLPTPLVKNFYAKRYSPDHLPRIDNLTIIENKIKSDTKVLENTKIAIANESITEFDINNQTYDRSDVETKVKDLEDSIENKKKIRDELKALIDSTDKNIDVLWTLTASAFVVGGLVGALTSKYVAEYFGRKKGIIFHYAFSIIGGVLSVVSYYIDSPECVIIGRFFYGLQGGMACGLIPTYLNEVSPAKLRGATGVTQQLFLTIGICTSQILGFRQILGQETTWHLLFGVPLFISIIGAILLLVIFPESPTILIRKYKNEKAAVDALKKLRNSEDVDYELEDIKAQINKDVNASQSVSIAGLFTASEYRWPLITGLVIQITQQLCGINAVFFYSENIFLSAKVKPSQIQYAVLLTGVINVLSTIIVVPLIDRLGRKPLLIYPMAFIIIDFIALTFFLVFKEGRPLLSHLSIVCIVLFIVCFAVGLGPIPFLYVPEVFSQEARSTAMAVCMFSNWLAGLILALTFRFIARLLGPYTFLVFTVIVAAALAFIIKFVPETKNRSLQQIMAQFNPKHARNIEESSGKLMENKNA